MNHLGIIAAVTAEARTLTQKPVPSGELIYLPGGAMLVVSGMGSMRATRTSRALVERGATALLSWGSAGGLASKLAPGSLILPESVIASDQSFYPVDAAWHVSLCNRLKGHVDFYTEPLVESPRVVRTPEEKTTLFQETGAIGVDMESAAVAVVARELHVRFMVVRAVADTADTTLPKAALNATDEFGGLNFLKLIWGLAKNPTELFTLIRIARDYRMAQGTLAAAASLIGEDFLIS